MHCLGACMHSCFSCLEAFSSASPLQLPDLCFRNADLHGFLTYLRCFSSTFSIRIGYRKSPMPVNGSNQCLPQAFQTVFSDVSIPLARKSTDNLRHDRPCNRPYRSMPDGLLYKASHESQVLANGLADSHQPLDNQHTLQEKKITARQKPVYPPHAV